MRQSAHIILSMLLIGGVFLLNSCKSKKGSSANSVSTSIPEDRFAFDDYFIDATTHFNNNNNETAKKLFEKCLIIKPNEPATLYMISRIEKRSGEQSKALHHATKAVELDPENSFYALWLARLYIYGFDKSSAISVLEKSFKFNPKNESIANVLDTLYLKTGQVDKNIEHWKTFIENKGFNVKYASNLLSLYKSKKDYISAHKLYDEIKNAAPLKVRYYIEDGNLYNEENNEEKAMVNFKKAIEIQPDNYSLNYALFQYYFKKKEYANIKVYAKNAIGDPLTDFNTKKNILPELKSAIQSDSSLLELAPWTAHKLIEQYPSNQFTYMAASEFYLLQNNLKSAFFSYKKASTLNPNLFDAWTGAFKCSHVFKSEDTITELLNSAIDYYPFSSLIYSNAAESSLKAGFYASAIKYSEEGLKLAAVQTDKTKLFFLLSKSQLLSGHTELAKSNAEEGLKIIPDDQLLLEIMGDIYSKMGKKNEAMEYWQKALKAGNTSSELVKKMNP